MTKQEDLIFEIRESFEQLKIKKESTFYITGNISQLARTRIKKKELLDIFLDTSLDYIGGNGTIFSPSASMNLCNTEIPFDIYNTPSHSMGALAEHLRTSKNAVRSFHPFWSISGIGAKSSILKNVSRHSYGLGSPWTYFLELDAMQVNIGLHPSKAVTLIHHLEVAAGVPYRYTKEFLHPIVKNKTINIEPFYMSVMYLDSDIKKRIALNEHFFQELDNLGQLNHYHQANGLDMWSFSMRDFKKVATAYFIKDIYNYLEQPPQKRPYQK
jgi:aminoglycoside 3-N-acetyltransferase